MSLICQSNTNNCHNSIIFNKINDEVLFFPQMKPEKAAPSFELNEDEKRIVDILSSQSEPMELSVVKTKSDLSGKKWDKATKNLTKNNIVKVEKIDEVLLMALV